MRVAVLARLPRAVVAVGATAEEARVMGAIFTE